MPNTQIVLLRGINVGRAKRVAMALAPPLTLILLVLGSIILGIATVNQAGAVGDGDQGAGFFEKGEDARRDPLHNVAFVRVEMDRVALPEDFEPGLRATYGEEYAAQYLDAQVLDAGPSSGGSGNRRYGQAVRGETSGL